MSEPTANLPAGMSGTFTRKCECGATVHVVDTVEQTHDHTRERLEVTTSQDLTLLRAHAVDSLNAGPGGGYGVYLNRAVLALIDHVGVAEAKVAAVREVANKAADMARCDPDPTGYVEGWCDASRGLRDDLRAALDATP